MIKIRLDRGGIRNKPSYRIVAVDSKSKKGGRALDILGHWHPKQDDKVIDKQKLDKWVQNGAQISAAVKKLIQ